MPDKQEINETLAPVVTQRARFLCRFTPSLAEDIIQSSWVQIYKNIKNLNNKQAIVKWALRIVDSVFYTHCRRNSRPSDSLDGVDMPVHARQEANIIDKQQLQSAKMHVGALNEKCRLIFSMRLDGHRFLDISALTGEKESTIKSRYYTALRIVRKKCVT